MEEILHRRRSRLLERRFAHSGLPEHKTLQDLDFSYNPKLPKRALLELATLSFITARENVLLIGPPGTGKSHAAKALALLAVQRGHKVQYREAHALIEEVHLARQLAEIKKYRAQSAGAMCPDRTVTVDQADFTLGAIWNQ